MRGAGGGHGGKGAGAGGSERVGPRPRARWVNPVPAVTRGAGTGETRPLLSGTRASQGGRRPPGATPHAEPGRAHRPAAQGRGRGLHRPGERRPRGHRVEGAVLSVLGSRLVFLLKRGPASSPSRGNRGCDPPCTGGGGGRRRPRSSGHRGGGPPGAQSGPEVRRAGGSCSLLVGAAPLPPRAGRPTSGGRGWPPPARWRRPWAPGPALARASLPRAQPRSRRLGP